MQRDPDEAVTLAQKLAMCQALILLKPQIYRMIFFMSFNARICWVLV